MRWKIEFSFFLLFTAIMQVFECCAISVRKQDLSKCSLFALNLCHTEWGKSHYLRTFINKRSMVFKKEANNLINVKHDMKYSYTLHCSDSYNVCGNEAVLATSPIVFQWRSNLSIAWDQEKHITCLSFHLFNYKMGLFKISL